MSSHSFTKIDQKQYLKKYLSGDKVKKKKRDKDKKPTSASAKVKIIDDDINHFDTGVEIDEELLLAGEDAPQIVGEYIEERPADRKVPKWKSIGIKDEPNDEQHSLKRSESDLWGSKSNRGNEKREFSIDRNHSNRALPNRKDRQRHNSSSSPPRRSRKSPDYLTKFKNEPQSPPSLKRDRCAQHKNNRRSISLDISPPRKRNNEYDAQRRGNSPTRSYRKLSPDQSPRRRGRNSNLSPPRRLKSPAHHRRDMDQSPPRANKNAFRSPPRVRRDFNQSPADRRKSPVRNERKRSPFPPQNHKRRNSDQSLPRISKRIDHSPSRRGRNLDQSPPRFSKRNDHLSPRRGRNSDQSPPRLSKRNDHSPPRRGKNFDQSPPRLFKRNDQSPPRRGKNFDQSPPRLSKRNNHSPPGRGRNSDQSPPRSFKRIDHSPPGRGRNSHQSPPRLSKRIGHSPPGRGRDSRQSPPPRKTRNPFATSPPLTNRNRRQTPDNFLPRKGRKTPDQSPIRGRRFSDISPPQKARNFASDYKKHTPDRSPLGRKKRPSIESRRNVSPDRLKREKRTQDLSPPPRRSGWERQEPSRSDSPPPTHRPRSGKTLDGKKAGLQDAQSLKKETMERRKQEDVLFEKMSSHVSGRAAEVQVRSTGRKGHRARAAAEEDSDERRRKEEHEERKKMLYERWGKGLKQIEDHKNRMQEMKYESSKPLARYSNDEDLERHLKEQERAEDPMLNYMRKKRKEKEKQSGKPQVPRYEGPYPENRFGIRPGYRWDGVDRSNGYEKKYFAVQNEKRARQDEAYKYSVEDM